MARTGSQSMDRSDEILSKLGALSPEQRQLVLDFAEFLLQKQKRSKTGRLTVHISDDASNNVQSDASTSARVFGLHSGQVWMSDDFDAPLPDEFWFGKADPMSVPEVQIEHDN